MAGGTESRYQYLKQVFPDAELISYADLFHKGKINVEYKVKEAAKKMDEYYIKRYKENKNILIIRDASVGGILDTSHIPQITIFANPYKSLSEIFDFGKEHWEDLIELQKKAKNTLKIATSNFMAKDMEKIGLIPDKIIHNPVDIDFFKSLKNKKRLRKKYKIPQNKKVGIWVGNTNNQIKNSEMILGLTRIFDKIFWILVTKNKAKINNKNIKLFQNVSKKMIRDLYNCADFFILTSPVEGFGMATLEAMACNLPCILSKTGYFYNFWDNRVGLLVWDYSSLLLHTEAIKIILRIKTNPRQVIIEKGLDLKNWEKKWKNLKF